MRRKPKLQTAVSAPAHDDEDDVEIVARKASASFKQLEHLALSEIQANQNLGDKPMPAFSI